jgi:hypothetical protein
MCALMSSINCLSHIAIDVHVSRSISDDCAFTVAEVCSYLPEPSANGPSISDSVKVIPMSKSIGLGERSGDLVVVLVLGIL